MSIGTYLIMLIIARIPGTVDIFSRQSLRLFYKSLNVYFFFRKNLDPKALFCYSSNIAKRKKRGEKKVDNRERFSSRIGFILTSAGCAIGLGNVWRFPYIAGKYGGAAFVLVYLVLLAIIG